MSYTVRQLMYAVVSGCRYGLLTDVFHLIAFRFETEVTSVEVCCKPVPTAGRCPASAARWPGKAHGPHTCLFRIVQPKATHILPSTDSPGKLTAKRSELVMCSVQGVMVTVLKVQLSNNISCLGSNLSHSAAVAAVLVSHISPIPHCCASSSASSA